MKKTKISNRILKTELVEWRKLEWLQPPRLKQIIFNQKAFWDSAADQWEALGKPFKRNDCKSAAQALLLAIS